MHGDFSRVTFDPSRHFSRVLVQQGRVTVDAEPNEQTAILLHLMRAFMSDLTGGHGIPVPTGAPQPNGFRIEPPAGAGDGFAITAGRYYVDGILVQNEEPGSTYFAQPDYFPEEDGLPDVYLVYLDVWERHLTFRDRPRIQETALGDEIDTCSRAQTVWQVKVTDKLKPIGNTEPSIEDIEDAAQGRGAQVRPQLRARVKPGPVSTSPCDAPPSAGYRGAENQLYRVEVHSGTTQSQPATFKWSRDNGAIVFGVISFEGSSAKLASLGRDPTRSLDEGDVVELLYDRLVLHEQPGFLARVTKVFRELLQVELEFFGGGTPTAIPEDNQEPALRHAFLRRWDHAVNGTPNGANPVTESDNPDVGWIDLEDGVQVQFRPHAQPNAPVQYRTGDYWLIPARTATGDVEWPHPGEGGDFRDTDGIKHGYAPLAFVPAGGGLKRYRRLISATPSVEQP